MRSSFSALLWLVWFSGHAQNIPASDTPVPDSTRTTYKRPDSLKIKFYPRSFRVGTDLIAIIKSQTVETYSGWELHGDIDCGRYYMAVDYGHWGRDYILDDGGIYENYGSYWRVGVDANLLTKDPDRNMFFFGFRYSRSSFRESTTFLVTDPIFGDFQKELTNPSVSAGWAELTSGLRVKIFKEFWMGYMARMKFGRSVSGDTEFKTYDIPGYGINSETIYWQFHYQVFWRIPFKKEKK